MSFFRQALVGVFAAVAVSLLVIGAIVLGMTEGMVLPDVSQVTEVQSTTSLETQFPGVIFTTPTPRRTNGPRLVAATTQPAVAACAARAAVPDWKTYTFQAGDSLSQLAAVRGTTVDQIIANNCMETTGILPGWKLFLPPVLTTATPQTPTAVPPTRTPSYRSPTPCKGAVVPANWVHYTVQPNDTLYKIAGGNPSLVVQIQQVNCIGNPNDISAGDRLWVPFVPQNNPPTRTPQPPTATSRPVVNTRTFTPRPSNTPTVTATFTPTQSATLTVTVTFTATFTSTFTFTPQPTATFTFTPVPATVTRTLTPIGTILAKKTSIPTATFTFTPTTGP